MESKDEARESAGCAREECSGSVLGVSLVSGKRSGLSFDAMEMLTGGYVLGMSSSRV